MTFLHKKKYKQTTNSIYAQCNVPLKSCLMHRCANKNRKVVNAFLDIEKNQIVYMFSVFFSLSSVLENLIEKRNAEKIVISFHSHWNGRKDERIELNANNVKCNFIGVRKSRSKKNWYLCAYIKNNLSRLLWDAARCVIGKKISILHALAPARLPRKPQPSTSNRLHLLGLLRKGKKCK